MDEPNSWKRSLSLSECVQKLFGITLSCFPAFKDSLNSLLRNKVIDCEKVLVSYATGGRAKQRIPLKELDALHNAILIHGLCGEPKTVKKVFEKPEDRREFAEWIACLMLDRHSLVGIGLYPKEVLTFLELLKSDVDLRAVRLPNPFVELPQLSFKGVSSVMQAMLAQNALISGGDTMMAAYFEGDLQRAFDESCKLSFDNPQLQKYKALIEKEYREAREFDELLDFFR